MSFSLSSRPLDSSISTSCWNRSTRFLAARFSSGSCFASVPDSGLRSMVIGIRNGCFEPEDEGTWRICHQKGRCNECCFAPRVLTAFRV